MREVWDILKIRWPEVVMLVGLQAGAAILYRQLMVKFETMAANGSQMPWLPSFLLGLGSMTLLIVLQMQIWGFLRTAALRPAEPCRPVELLRTGSPFFWRLLGFQILFSFALAFVYLVVATLLGILIFRRHAVGELPVWLHSLSVFLGFLLLLKPFVLMPALVLTYDYRLVESFFTLQDVSFLRMRGPLFWAVGFAAFTALSVAMGGRVEQRQWAWIVQGVEGLAAGFLLLGVYLAAILGLPKSQPEDSAPEPGDSF